MSRANSLLDRLEPTVRIRLSTASEIPLQAKFVLHVKGLTLGDRRDVARSCLTLLTINASSMEGRVVSERNIALHLRCDRQLPDGQYGDL